MDIFENGVGRRWCEVKIVHLQCFSDDLLLLPFEGALHKEATEANTTDDNACNEKKSVSHLLERPDIIGLRDNDPQDPALRTLNFAISQKIGFTLVFKLAGLQRSC